jgi:hypothetical protein
MSSKVAQHQHLWENHQNSWVKARKGDGQETNEFISNRSETFNDQ